MLKKFSALITTLAGQLPTKFKVDLTEILGDVFIRNDLTGQIVNSSTLSFICRAINQKSCVLKADSAKSCIGKLVEAIGNIEGTIVDVKNMLSEIILSLDTVLSVKLTVDKQGIRNIFSNFFIKISVFK